MIFKNGVTNEPVMVADLDMVSADTKRVVLRYNGKLWDDVLFEAMKMACERDAVSVCTDRYEDLVSDTILHIGFNIQLASVRPYADLSVKTTSGALLKKRFILYGETEEVVNILNRFFAEGCQGVSPSFADHFARYYAAWQSSQKK